jgi:hypothetical protein
MSSPAVPLTQARSHTRRLPREPALAHQRAFTSAIRRWRSRRRSVAAGAGRAGTGRDQVSWRSMCDKAPRGRCAVGQRTYSSSGHAAPGHPPRLQRLRARLAALARPVPGLRRVEHAGGGARARCAGSRGRWPGGWSLRCARGPTGPPARGANRGPRAAAHRAGGAGPRVGRRAGARLARVAGRLAGHRQVDLDGHGAGPSRGGRMAHPVRLGRGVARADPPARGAPGGGRARRARAGRDGPYDRMHDAPGHRHATRVVHAGLPPAGQGEPFLPGPTSRWPAAPRR